MPLLSVLRFSEGSCTDYFACLDVDGVENDSALDEPASPSLALNLKPPIVGQSAVECGAASQVDGRHFRTLLQAMQDC